MRFFKRTDSSFDRYTSGSTAEFQAWMRERFFRAEVWSPYFDDKTAWYPQGLVSQNLYAIYRDDHETLTTHPEWVLRDGAGAPLYIPWGCSGGTCPQYAGDVGNADFRRAWIERARSTLSRGYRGLWIDDVNLEFRVGDGTGRWQAPLDPRTGRPMTTEDWRRYVVEFVEEIRRALPAVEILHNTIWFAAQPERAEDPFVRRQIAAADRINLERGVNDAGLTGGTGQWSLQAFLAYVDTVHAAGRTVVLDAFDDSPRGREYNLAAYFLVSQGGDGLGLAQMTPDNWWAMYDVQLGAPASGRRTWQGLLRRDFDRGVVLLSEPDAPTRTVDLGRRLVTSTGCATTTVTLSGGEGVVLRRPSRAVSACTDAGPAGPGSSTDAGPTGPAPLPTPAAVAPATGLLRTARRSARPAA
ncbi:putative glycoside hydrolase [Geodermatophilus sp. SYSU D00684]